MAERNNILKQEYYNGCKIFNNHFEFKRKLCNLKVGSHTMIVYPDLIELREIYTSFCKHALTNNNDLVIILYHYDNPENIRYYYLQNIGIDVEKYEKEHSLLIMDSYKPSLFQGNNNLKIFEKSILKKSKENGKNGISIIADMGSFFYKGKGLENRKLLLSFEYSLSKKFNANVKRICLYHKEDIKRISKSEKESLYKFHFQCFVYTKFP